MKRLLFILIISFITIPNITQAAVLYIETESNSYYQGDTFIVEARVETEECINTIEADLSFPQDILEVIDFSQGNSILVIWLEKPVIKQETGSVSFTGGIPGGYCGRLPGDPGVSNLLGKIIFKVKKEKLGQVAIKFLDTSQVLLNDGFGTPAELKTQEGVFNILSGVPETLKEEWQEELEKDKISPEPFEIKVSQDPAIFDNKYFITFSTTDKQTGVDYYEVKEGERDWKRIESPYLLEDQTLTSIIKVKAVDKAGNEQIAEQLPLRKPIPWQKIFAVLAAMGIVWWISQKIKTRREGR